MSSSVSLLIAHYVQRRLFVDGELMYPNKDFVIQFDGSEKGLAFYGLFNRIALMEAALILLDTDNARIMREAIRKGVRLTLTKTEKPASPLWEAMKIELTGVTELNGKEFQVVDSFLDKLNVHMVNTAQTIFNECVEIRSSGLDDVNYLDDGASLNAVNCIIAAFKQHSSVSA